MAKWLREWDGMWRKGPRLNGTNWKTRDGSQVIVGQWFSVQPFMPEQISWPLRQMLYSHSVHSENTWTLVATWDNGRKLYMMTLFTSSPETDLDSRAENGKRSIADLIKAVSLWIAVCLLLPFPRRNGRYQVHLPDSSDLLKHCIKTSRNGDNS